MVIEFRCIYSDLLFIVYISLYIPVTTLDDSQTQYFKGKRQTAEEYIQSDIIQNRKIGRMIHTV